MVRCLAFGLCLFFFAFCLLSCSCFAFSVSDDGTVGQAVDEVFLSPVPSVSPSPTRDPLDDAQPIQDLNSFWNSYSGNVDWVGDFVALITSNDLLLLFVIVALVGLGVGLISRLIHL